MKPSLYYHLLAGSGSIALFMYCAIAYLVPSGNLQLVLPLTVPSPTIRLVPESRVSSLIPDAVPYKEFIAEPIYLDIHSPGKFREGTIHITYANPDGHRLSFGDVKYGKLEHHFFASLPKTDARPHTIDIPIDFSKLDYRGHRYRIAFSLPERPKTSHVRIYGITVDLKRPPL